MHDASLFDSPLVRVWRVTNSCYIRYCSIHKRSFANLFLDNSKTTKNYLANDILEGIFWF